MRVTQHYTYFLILITLFSSTLSSISLGHSGGLNSRGCHAGSKPYHCHRSQSDMVTTSNGRNRLRCSLGSTSKECISGSTSSSSVAASVSTLRLQKALMRHCTGIASSSIDGVFGSQTKRFLMAFQRSHSLIADGIVGKNTAKALAGPRTGQCNIR
jgi:peptidoglycan hydrolase-like protein with peptidoglycan-binding domain